ncbi:hypothetical protein BZA05DRAFT_401825 [Tricharina praecox]|uniref:uncharacterized protein n=1 Tax=Tricharina praecox TaxID=43433 RepID=UPI002220356D|nr:uncharacterized protein BZA05DRAFT_401825 [Tricharina praecox]KAI5849875.1 hypothetical protein BZA05DRAFT_401825 [Tricharina praecox]
MSLPLVRLFPRLVRPTVATTSITATRYKSHKANTSGDVPSKDELKPTSKESTRSGTNDQIAHEDAAFNPNSNPVEEKGDVGREEGSPSYGMENPLEFSGATPEVSHQTRDDRVVKGGDKKPSGGSKGA